MRFAHHTTPGRLDRFTIELSTTRNLPADLGSLRRRTIDQFLEYPPHSKQQTPFFYTFFQQPIHPPLAVRDYHHSNSNFFHPFSTFSLIFDFFHLFSTSSTRFQRSARIPDEYQPSLIFLSQATCVFFKKSPIFNHFRALSLIFERVCAFLNF